MDTKYQETRLFTPKRMWTGLEKAIPKEVERILTEKQAQRQLPYELAPVTPRNLVIAMNFYFPEIQNSNYKAMTVNKISITPVNGCFAEDETKECFHNISLRINRSMANVTMDIIENYIIKTMLHIPFAVQETNPVYYSSPAYNPRTQDYMLMGHVGLLNAILAANIDNWHSLDHENSALFSWLKTKLEKQEKSMKFDKSKPKF